MFEGRTLAHQVGIAEGDAVEVVDLGVGVALRELVHLPLLVLDLEVDLRALGVALERRDQLGERLPLLAHQVQHLDHRQQRAVGVGVVAEVVVARELAAEDRLALAHRRLDERVPHPLAHRDAALLLDVLGHRPRRAQVVDHRLARLALQQLAADQRRSSGRCRSARPSRR